MRSVSDQLSGVASGINNAVTRISNVFANAIFGALAVLLFAGALESKINKISLGTEEKKVVIGQAVNLGNARAPDGIDGRAKMMIGRAYRESFIHTYAFIMRLSAGLAFLGALMAVFFIKNPPPANTGGDSTGR